MRIAVAAYPAKRLSELGAVEAKLDSWLGEAAAAGAELAVFPEYAGLELALAGGAPVAPPEPATQIAADIARSAELAPTYRDIIGGLARRHGLYVVAGSLPVSNGATLRNRAYVFAPEGELGWQDKCILTPWERQNTPLGPGDRLHRFDLPVGVLGVLVCYDCEFPLLARAFRADLLAVPACTDTPAGQNRVRLAARARALEGFCITAQAPLLGEVPACPMIDINTGRAGVFAPPDLGFPEDGILADGATDAAGWLFCDIDPAALHRARRNGAVAPHLHWNESEARAASVAERRSRQVHP